MLFHRSIGLLSSRQRLSPTHDFENLGRDGRLTRPVVGQLQGLEQLTGVVTLLLLRRLAGGSHH